MSSPTRASLVAGQGRVVRGSYNSLPETDYTLALKESLTDVKIGGQTIDKRVLEYNVDLSIPGDGRMGTDALTLYWNQFSNMALGATLFGATDTPTVVHGTDGATHTIIASQCIKPPSMILHPDKGAVGGLTIAGIIGNALAFTDANSLHDIGTGGSYTDVAFTPAQILRQQYFAVWGAVAGFTDFQMQDGWTIDFNLTATPIKVQGVTRDYKFTQLEIMARGIPVGPTPAQIQTAMKVTGTGATVGRSLHANAASLVISGADAVAYVTIPKAALYTGGYTFSGEKLRNGEVAFYGCRNFATGVQAALYTIANS